MPDYITRAEWDALQARFERIAGVAADVKAMLADTHAPSKAQLLGNPRIGAAAGPESQPGAFLQAIMGMRSNDPEAFAAAKATLIGLGSAWRDVPAESKATLGDTAAAGGWIVPNALVDRLHKPAGYRNIYREICDFVPGIVTESVDVPLRNAGPTRMTVQSRGSTKENKDLVYDGYTATMYTLARIYDLANQYVRQSQGAAERDVMEELGTAYAKGSAYYIVQGSGSTEPYGLVTAFSNAPAAFTSSFSPASTLAGSVATAIGTAAGALAGRDETPTATVLNAQTYWTMLTQGTDTAGFFFAAAAGENALPGVAAGTLVSPFGIPVYPDSQFPTDDLIVGNFRRLRVYEGEGFRIDSSNQAGDRWDNNLTGFRGEAELGFDARPWVYSGGGQYVADVTP